MSSVSGTNNSTDATGAAASQLAASSAEQLSQQFLTMLSAQMQNQDPLNPLDNAELTSQLAQISTVSGISQLNTTMQWLGYSMGSLQATQAMSMIGHSVMVTGDDLTLKDGKATLGGYNLPTDVASAKVVVKNATGQQVASFSVDGIDAGVHTFTWDGTDGKGNTLADGDYSFEVQVSDGTNNGVATSLQQVQVASVQPASGGTIVVDNKGNSSNLSDVYQVW